MNMSPKPRTIPRVTGFAASRVARFTVFVAPIDANEDSQAVAEAHQMRAAYGQEEASAPPIVS
jgi:hypothetical protein